MTIDDILYWQGRVTKEFLFTAEEFNLMCLHIKACHRRIKAVPHAHNPIGAFQACEICGEDKRAHFTHEWEPLP